MKDFYLRVTNLPGYPNQKYRDTVAERDSSISFSRSKGVFELDPRDRDAIAEDAVNFARWNQG